MDETFGHEESGSAVIDGAELVAVALWTGALRAKGMDTVKPKERLATFQELPAGIRETFLREAQGIIDDMVDEAHAKYCPADLPPEKKIILS